MFDIAFGVMLGLLLFCVGAHPSGTIRPNHWWQSKADQTDDPANDKHSGLVLYIDYGTGCHYIANSVFGGLIPRLDRDGKHICEPKP